MNCCLQKLIMGERLLLASPEMKSPNFYITQEGEGNATVLGPQLSKLGSCAHSIRTKPQTQLHTGRTVGRNCKYSQEADNAVQERQSNVRDRENDRARTIPREARTLHSDPVSEKSGGSSLAICREKYFKSGTWFLS